jgi:hypothetical protein
MRVSGLDRTTIAKNYPAPAGFLFRPFWITLLAGRDCRRDNPCNGCRGSHSEVAVNYPALKGGACGKPWARLTRGSDALSGENIRQTFGTGR